MRTFNNNQRLDNSSGIGQDTPNKAMQPASETKKTPWHLRFAPGVILRKSGIIAVLATATALSTIQIEQLEAASASTNRITRQMPDRSESPTSSTNRVIPRRNIARPTYRPSTNRVVRRAPTYTTRTNQVRPTRNRVAPTSRTTQPAAVPPPLLAPAAPVIKKGVLAAGTFLVAAVGEWFIGKQLDKLTQAELDKAAGQTATCGVESILWERNSTKVTTRAIAGFSNMWGLLAGQSTTLSVSQGQEDTPASGTFQGPTVNRTLTEAQADSHLYHARGTLVMSTYELINSRGRIDTVTIQAREDKVAEQNKKLIQRVKRRTGDSSWRFHKHIDERKVEYNVGSHRVTSDFDDPIPTYSKLREPGVDERAHTYEATVTWKMRRLLENGTWGPEKNMKHTFPKGDKNNRDEYRLPSYEDNSFPWDFCESNQKITAPSCRASINRRVEDYDITERRRVPTQESNPYTGYSWEWRDVKIGT